MVQTFKRRLAGVLRISHRIVCPACHSGDITGHGSRPRKYQEIHKSLYPGGKRPSTAVYRMRCKPCRKTFTILPSWLSPRKLYTTPVREVAVNPVRNGISLWSVASSLGMASGYLIRVWTDEIQRREPAVISALEALLHRYLARELPRTTPKTSVPVYLRLLVMALLPALTDTGDPIWEYANILTTRAWLEQAATSHVAL